ncbi:MAG: hypothetical protein GY875_15675 [Gammaproteobacteria bacterium]|nr:hypothetical protein [Gammaproteobacteria bacterium]
MKTSLIALTACVVLSMPVHAKQPEAPDLSPIVEQMQLNSEQATRLNELVQQHHAQMKNMHQQRNQEQSQQRGDMHEQRMQHREDLLSVLSYEQLYEFENYMHQQRGQHREKRAISENQN